MARKPKRPIKVGTWVEADGLICEVLEVVEYEGETYYEVTPVSGYARGFVRTFTADKLTPA